MPGGGGEKGRGGAEGDGGEVCGEEGVGVVRVERVEGRSISSMPVLGGGSGEEES